ncbi:hypothetical protein [Winogradskyella sp. A3E31]|uniref:hypothetical protein n=1 Tax=Winogradskyella sp. A3E31 TaxID=3349637 RepID=UPI00398B1D51
MVTHSYILGAVKPIEELFPDPEIADKSLKFQNYSDVISYYTHNSLKADGVSEILNVEVTPKKGNYEVTLSSSGSKSQLVRFAERHVEIFNKNHAQKAIKGMELLKEFGVWNPMKNYHVNDSPSDGTSKWCLFPPLGLNVMGQKGLLLMHYPPWAVPQLATFNNAMTMNRWERILKSAGVLPDDVDYYKTFIDVNPIAAPGSGESEYPNDYFPIMMASAFFDGPKDRDYIKSMLELYLTPPGWEEDNKYTLPLLICGSPLYDPQAPGWFRTAYTDILPQDANKIPQVNVMQVGTFKVRPDSKRETPYFIGNHMIAAGVTGKCTKHPDKIPDIRQYQAQDLVAATFLKLYHDNPNIHPEEAKRQACERWYGNPYGLGAPEPKAPNDRRTICALAQMDLFFEPLPKPHPKYTFEEAWKRCADAEKQDNPCSGKIKPGGTKG